MLAHKNLSPSGHRNRNYLITLIQSCCNNFVDVFQRYDVGLSEWKSAATCAKYIERAVNSAYQDLGGLLYRPIFDFLFELQLHQTIDDCQQVFLRVPQVVSEVLRMSEQRSAAIRGESARAKFIFTIALSSANHGAIVVLRVSVNSLCGNSKCGLTRP